MALMGAVRLLHDALRDYDLVVAKALSLQRTELECLLLLERGPVRVSFVVSRVGLTSGAVTTLLDRLERRRLIKRCTGLSDRRVVEVDLTPKARARIGELYRRGFLAMAARAEEHRGLDACAEVLHALADASRSEASLVS